MSVRVCVIGAGVCGLAAAQVLSERGIPFDVFEKGSDIGGQWRFGNDSGTSAVYDSIELNSSRDMSGFPKFPMPEDYPLFPGHPQMLDYLTRYTEHFGLRPYIRFRTSVTGVVKDGAGYVVTLDDGRMHRYTHVVVANGFHWDPKWPKPAYQGQGEFTGIQLHSKDYKSADTLRGRRVLVVGFGNTACDLATELSAVADRVVSSARRGFWITPKRLFGRPADKVNRPLATIVPPLVQSLLLTAMLWVTQGRISRYGLAAPGHLALRTHPATCEGYLPAVKAGRIVVRPGIERFDGGNRVRFTDGSAEEFDAIVWCTGFRFSFPFLPEELTPVMVGPMRLFRRIVMPDHEGLFFLGFAKTLSAITPVAEAQAEWIADLIEGRTRLPGREAMLAEIAADERRVRRRYCATPRLTVEVDVYRYLRQLLRDRRRHLAAGPPLAVHRNRDTTGDTSGLTPGPGPARRPARPDPA
ncbi:NAD(P)-binding domain-containing protein [Streptomyces sp. NPDC020996]|uniref:flavin-containing monooxygenase n=1 Tax=Streptomyces sp. NPDC020996 TaxID=3154791 RepID=UPI00340D6A06